MLSVEFAARGGIDGEQVSFGLRCEEFIELGVNRTDDYAPPDSRRTSSIPS